MEKARRLRLLERAKNVYRNIKYSISHPDSPLKDKITNLELSLQGESAELSHLAFEAQNIIQENESLIEKMGNLDQVARRRQADKKDLNRAIKDMAENYPLAVIPYFERDSDYATGSYLFFSPNGEVLGHTEKLHEVLGLESIRGKNYPELFTSHAPQVKQSSDLKIFFKSPMRREFNLELTINDKTETYSIVKEPPIILGSMGYQVGIREIKTSIGIVPVSISKKSKLGKTLRTGKTLQEVVETNQTESEKLRPLIFELVMLGKSARDIQKMNYSEIIRSHKREAGKADPERLQEIRKTYQEAKNHKDSETT
jgi:hypothetical protein